MSTTLEMTDLAVADASAADIESRFTLFDHVADLDRLQPAWQTLAERCGTPMEHPDWGQACAETLLGTGRLQVAAFERAGELVALAPLALAPGHGIRRLVLLGVGELHEPSDLLAADPHALRSLVRGLLKQGRPLLLERVRTDSPTLVAIDAVASGRAVVIRRPQASCPYITLDASWLQPLEHLNAGRRSDLRRARRKAEQLGPLTTEILTPHPDEVESLLGEALAIEQRSWKGESGTALACDPARARFFADYAARAAATGSLRLCFMKIGDQRVAMQVAVEQQGGFWLLKVGYDAEYANCSPGLLLMHDTIAYAAQQNLQNYELLGKSDAWTQVWTKTERECVSLRVYPLNFRGLTALGIDAGAAGLRAAAGKVRRWKGKS